MRSNRAAGDGAFEDGAIWLHQPLDIGDRGEAAGGDHGDPDRTGERQRRREVDPLQDAVAIDVGIDDRRDAGVLEFLRQVDDAEFRGLRPALDRNLAALGVDADDDAAGKQPAGSANQLGIAHRDRAEDDARHAFREPRFDPGDVADAAAEFDLDGGGCQNRLNRRAVDRAALEGAVEVDDMQPVEAE
eukprot:gene28299-31509_t